MTVVRTRRSETLAQASGNGTVAVICSPEEQPGWTGEVSAAVEAGRFRLPRAVLPPRTRPELAAWLSQALPRNAVSAAARQALAEDVLSLVDLQTRLTGEGRVILRLFAEAPTPRCGFHVDTVPPRAPIVGLLKVYNGPGTSYAEPADVTDTRAFYRYLSRRERLGRELSSAARERGNRYAELLEEAYDLDATPGFLKEPGLVSVAPAGSTIAFKHLDVRQHWSSHLPDRAWIHCSPAEGPPRLVANVTPAGDFRAGGPR